MNVNSRLLSLLLRANNLRRDLDYAGALQIYLEVMQQSGDDADLLAAIADCHHWLALHVEHDSWSNHTASVEWATRAVQLEPHSSRLHTLLAFYYQVGLLDYGRAAEEYRAAVRANPENSSALLGLTSLYDVPDQVVGLEEAIECLERALQFECIGANFQVRLGQLYLEAGKIEDAETIWRRALLSPLSPDSGYIELIRMYIGL